MPWVTNAGSVSVADDGTMTATPVGCFAEWLYSIVFKGVDDAFATDEGVPPPPIPTTDTAYVKKLKYFALQANRFATILSWMSTNSRIQVDVGGLQNLPNPANPGSPTDAPSSPVNLDGKII